MNTTTVLEDEIAAAPAVQRCIEPSCGARYELAARLYVCARCGGLLDVVRDLAEKDHAGSVKGSDSVVKATGAALRKLWEERLASPDYRDRSGVWRYRELLPFDDETCVVSLMEGNTPLYDAPRSAGYCGLDRLKLKHQGCNPTGSFKDTGMTAAVTQALRLKVETVVCASTGNTSASLAAYAARADLKCAILVPHGQISHAKLAQSLDYGAAVLELDGNFDDAMRVIRELAEDESFYLVNSINPFRIEGQKTVAVEMLQQLAWEVPDHVVVPGGNLGNSAALGKGLLELYALGVIDRLPKLTVVQAAGAAPFAHMFAGGIPFGSPASANYDWSLEALQLRPIEHPQTLASAIKIGSPVSWKKARRAVIETGGRVLSVSEQEIADAKAIIGRDGIGCEPASATTIAGLKVLVAEGFVGAGENVVAVLTGHVMKDADYAINYHRGTLVSHSLAPDGSAEEQHLDSTFANPPARIKATRKAIVDQLARRAEDSGGQAGRGRPVLT